MSLSLWLTFMGVITALIAFPGPSALLCMSHGVLHGHRKAALTVVGGAVAAMCLMTLSSLGLGALMAASQEAFTLVKLLGAGYLIYLGVQAWRSTASAVQADAQVAGGTISRSGGSLFRTGFMVGISNPKDLLFFAALFPNFIQLDQPQLIQFVVLGGSWFVMDCLIMFLYAVAGTRISPWFARGHNLKRFNRATGSLFIAAGGILAGSSR